MASESIITATFGVPGSGKTYSRVKWLVDDFLLNNPTGLYITNIPINCEAVADYFCNLHRQYTKEQILSRLIIIPDDQLIFWEKLNQIDNKELNTLTTATFPPTQFLQQYNLQGAHIAIDEFHKYFSKRGPKALKKLWNDWFAEIRKTGCVFEAITQSYGQMADEFLDKCGTRLELVNHADFRDPLFGIRLGDWYELRAGLIGKVPVQRVSERETMQGTSASGRLSWVPTGKAQTFVLEPEYFSLYDSFHNSTGTSGERKTPSQIYGKKIYIWFFRRNWINILPRILLACFVAWFLFCGGFGYCLNSVFSTFKYSGKSNTIIKTSNPVKKTLPQKTAARSGSQSHGLTSLQNSPQNGSSEKPVNLPVQPVFNETHYKLYKPALFYNGVLVLRNSLEVKKGYKFTDKGPYHGQTIIKINAENRSYSLADGTVITMF